MVADGTPLGALRATASVYYNHTGQAGKCFDFGPSGTEQVETTAPVMTRVESDGFSGANDDPPSGWGYQTCTEVLLKIHFETALENGKRDQNTCTCMCVCI